MTRPAMSPNHQLGRELSDAPHSSPVRSRANRVPHRHRRTASGHTAWRPISAVPPHREGVNPRTATGDRSIGSVWHRHVAAMIAPDRDTSTRTGATPAAPGSGKPIVTVASAETVTHTVAASVTAAVGGSIGVTGCGADAGAGMSIAASAAGGRAAPYTMNEPRSTDRLHAMALSPDDSIVLLRKAVKELK